MRPPIPLGGDLGRVIDDIYRQLEALARAVNQPAAKGATVTDKAGKSGDLRVVKGDKDQYHLEMKTADGWVRSSEDVFEKGTRMNT